MIFILKYFHNFIMLLENIIIYIYSHLFFKKKILSIFLNIIKFLSLFIL